LKAGKVVALLLILALAIVPVLPERPATGTSPYSERLDVYIAGSDAFWQMRLTGVNATNSVFSKVESTAGLDWYNVTMVKTTGWGSDFQIFGPGGYDLLPVPVTTQQAIYLQVDASSFSAALSVAQDFGPYFVTSFGSYSNSSGVFTFYSPVSFEAIAPVTLLTLLPSSGGFAGVISLANFTALQAPMVSLTGESGSSGFTHTLTLSSISSTALTSTGHPAFLTYFGSTATYIQAANKSSSSQIDVNVLDGLLTAANSTGVASDRQSFNSSYDMNLTPGQKVRSLNVTVTQQVPELLATRQIDQGVLRQGDNVSVTITLTNPGTENAYNVSVKDDWWSAYGFFKLVGGNDSDSYPVLKSGQTVSPTYQLEDTQNVTQQVTIPSANVTYFGAVGSKNETFYSSTNEAPISLGTDEPVVFAYLTSSSGWGGAIGSVQEFDIVVKNVGSRSATGVVVDGRSISSGLPADGGSITEPVSVTAPNLAMDNLSEVYSAQYKSPLGPTESVETNPVDVIFAQSSMKIALATLAVNATEVVTKSGSTNLTLSFTADNQGVANVTKFTASGSLPSGLPCGTAKESNLTCSGGVVSLDYALIKSGSDKVATMNFNLTAPADFIIAPFSYSATSSNYTLSGSSNAEAVPIGVSLSKSYSPDLLFGGMQTAATVTADNSGPYPLYNVTVQSNVDSFDSLPVGGAPTHSYNGTLAAGRHLIFSYNLTTFSTSGTVQSANVTASFFYGGEEFFYSRLGSTVSLYQPIAASVASVPAAPVEGKAFQILITLTNPSKVNVTDATFTLPLPDTISVINESNSVFTKGELLVNLPFMLAGKSYNASAFVTTSSGVSIPFSGSKLTFGYSGTTLKGTVPTNGIAINENVTTRYVIPVAIAVVVMFAFVVVMRRAVRPGTSSQQK